MSCFQLVKVFMLSAQICYIMSSAAAIKSNVRGCVFSRLMSKHWGVHSPSIKLGTKGAIMKVCSLPKEWLHQRIRQKSPRTTTSYHLLPLSLSWSFSVTSWLSVQPRTKRDFAAFNAHPPFFFFLFFLKKISSFLDPELPTVSEVVSCPDRAGCRGVGGGMRK